MASKDTAALAGPALEARRTERALPEAIADQVREITGDATVTDASLAKVLVLAKRALETRASSPLEEAARVLLSVMEPTHQDQVKDVAHDNGWPVWVVMLGAVARGADGMELNAGEFNPEWLNSPEAVGATPKTAFCDACGLEIPGARRGQRFCCNGCGSTKPHTAGCPAVAKAETAAVAA